MFMVFLCAFLLLFQSCINTNLRLVCNSIFCWFSIEKILCCTQFAYPTRPDNMIFNGLNLKIEAGKTVALVGPSGGGKSTTVSLVERFYDPISGSVKLDGTNIKDLNVNYLRSQIGYVGQEPALFATTVEHNIRYGKPDATKEEIIEACKKANAHDFIMNFSEGYETQVGDKGMYCMMYNVGRGT